MSARFSKPQRIVFSSIGIALFVGTSLAQNRSANWIGAPLVGLSANAGKTEIRPIQGVPGASTIGDPVALPAGVGRVHLAPFQQWALVEQGREGVLGRMAIDGIAPAGVAPIHGAMASPALVSFSSNGRSAALISRNGQTLQVLTHLADTPEIAMQSDVSQLGAMAAAVSDDGTVPLILSRDGSVYLISPGGSPSLLGRAGLPAGIGLLTSQSAAAIVDGAAGSVTIIDGLNTQSFTRTVVRGPILSGDAVFVQAPGDGQSLILGAFEGHTAYRVNLAGQTVSSLDLPAGISKLDRLAGDAYLFSSRPNEAAWILSLDGGNLTAGFVQFTGKLTPETAPGRTRAEER